MGNAPTNNYDDNLYLTPKEGVSFEEKIVEINGERRNRCHWTPTGQKPKGLVLISHGLHEHSLRYCGFAHEMCRRGFAVMAIDHKGHGMSEGPKGLISDFHVLEHDFVAFAKSASLEYNNIPCCLFAHSMGTLVASLALPELPFVKCVCFSGCCINAGPAAASPFGVSCLYPLSQTSAAVHLTAIMASVAPTGAAAPLLMDAITKDEEEKKIMLKDRRRFEGDIMNKSAYEVLKMIDAVKLVLPKINTPAHCVHGANDTVALPSGSEYLYTHIGTPGAQKTIHIYPGLLHELFHEDLASRTKAINDVADYLVKNTL